MFRRVGLGLKLLVDQGFGSLCGVRAAGFGVYSGVFFCGGVRLFFVLVGFLFTSCRLGMCIWSWCFKWWNCCGVFGVDGGGVFFREVEAGSWCGTLFM